MKKIPKSIALFCMLPLCTFAQAPKQVKYSNQVWLGDFTKIKCTERWSVYFDFGLRRSEWLDKWSQVFVRPGIQFALNKNITLTAGVAWFSHYAFTPVRPELRGWEQIAFSSSYGRVTATHRLRAEQRFIQRIIDNRLADEYVYTNRFRYQLNVQVALNKPSVQEKTLYLTFADEIMVNSGKEVRYNYFDQNRASAGIGYKLNEQLNISLAYMNVFIQKNQALQFENNNVVVVNLYHNFNFHKK